MTKQLRAYEVGERVGPYEVVDPQGFSGVLPTARIVKVGDDTVNVGVPVILTTTGVWEEVEDGPQEL